MRILIANRLMNNIAGGVEHMATALMNDMTSRGHPCALLTWDYEDGQSYYPMDETIQWFKLGIGDTARRATWGERLERMKATRKAVKEFQPDVIVGFQDGPFQAMALYTLGMNIPVILAERNAPHRFDYKKTGKYKELIFQTYRAAKAITVQCPSYVERYPKSLQSRITVIPNPVFAPPEANKDGAKAKDKKTLLSVGRLEYQKNFVCLLEAYQKIATDFPDWILKIIGEGDDRSKLEAYIETNNLQNHIQLPGTSKDVHSLYQNADLFVLPSRWEGFPNVLAEAMSNGLPAIGFDQCAGVRDLIEHNKNGLLATDNENSDTLAKTLKTLMADQDIRKKMGKEAKQSIQQFKPETVYAQWEQFLKQACNKD